MTSAIIISTRFDVGRIIFMNALPLLYAYVYVFVNVEFDTAEMSLFFLKG